MQQRLRLTRSEDIKRVRQEGQSLANAIFVIVFLPTLKDQTRIAVVAGKSVGGAVHRNFAKRRIRSALQYLIPVLNPGYDLMIIARKPILQVEFQVVSKKLKDLIQRAGLLKEYRID